MGWQPDIYLPPAQLARQEWEAQRSKAIAECVGVSIAFGAEAIASAALGQFILSGVCIVASVGKQLHAYYLADIVQPPDFSSQQQPTIE